MFMTLSSTLDYRVQKNFYTHNISESFSHGIRKEVGLQLHNILKRKRKEKKFECYIMKLFSYLPNIKRCVKGCSINVIIADPIR